MFFLWVVHYLREHSTVARLTEIRFYPKSDKSYTRQSFALYYLRLICRQLHALRINSNVLDDDVNNNEYNRLLLRSVPLLT